MSAQGKIQQTVLPIPDQPHVGLTTYDAHDPDTKYPPINELRPPKGAPNVLIILLDDVGFGAASAFGGPCQTPNFEKLAANGLKYNRFHTTALCSPTRQALLTGRKRYIIEGITKITAGKHQVRMEFKYDGGGLAKGGTVTLYMDGQKAGEGRVDQTEPMVFSADETCDVGNDFGSPLTYDYPNPKKFNGEVNWVELDAGKDDENNNHLIAPEERLHLAMAIQ
jgi:hypothetical protein